MLSSKSGTLIIENFLDEHTGHVLPIYTKIAAGKDVNILYEVMFLVFINSGTLWAGYTVTFKDAYVEKNTIK